MNYRILDLVLALNLRHDPNRPIGSAMLGVHIDARGRSRTGLKRPFWVRITHRVAIPVDGLYLQDSVQGASRFDLHAMPSRKADFPSPFEPRSNTESNFARVGHRRSKRRSLRRFLSMRLG